MNIFFDNGRFDAEEIRIFERFPKLFRQATLSMQESCMYWGLEIPDCWIPLVERLAEQINKIAPDCVEFSDVKEKWKELRIYVDFVGECDKETINKVCSLIDKTEAEAGILK
jgi:hypothetical protein